MMGKAQGLPADQVFLDLEDAVAPGAKEGARDNIVAALNEGDWAGKTKVVRVNDLTTKWTYRDVITVVDGDGLVAYESPSAHRVFGASAEEVERARALLAAWERAAARGVAAVEFDGAMIDGPALRMARDTIERGGKS